MPISGPRGHWRRPPYSGALAGVVARVFTASEFWQVARARFLPAVDHAGLPATLIERFRSKGAEQLVALLRFIAPVTGARSVTVDHHPHRMLLAVTPRFDLRFALVRSAGVAGMTDSRGPRIHSDGRICASP
jgi:hypothetical protein